MMKRRCSSPRSTKYWRASFRAASTASEPPADVEYATNAFWRMRNEIISQLLRDLRREKARVRVSELVELLVHRCQHVRMRMAETGHCRATGCIDIFLAGTVVDYDAAAVAATG